jgi:hypothetical protein
VRHCQENQNIGLRHGSPVTTPHPQHTDKETKQNKNKIARPGSWFIPIILATQEAEIRRIMVQSQLGQIVHETLSQKKPT